MDGSGPEGQGAVMPGNGLAGIGSGRSLADTACGELLATCADAGERVAALAGDDPELQRTAAELALLCRTTEQALAMGARTTRELRLICAALCHLCAEQCGTRSDPWSRRLVRHCRECAHACRQVMSTAPR